MKILTPRNIIGYGFFLAALLLFAWTRYEKWEEDQRYPDIKFQEIAPLPFHLAVPELKKEHIHVPVDFKTKIDGKWYSLVFYQKY